MTSVLAFDVGKSGCRVALFVDGVRTAEAERPGPRGLADPEGPAAAAAAMAAAAAEVTSSPVDAVAAGLSGLAQAPSAASELAGRLAQQHDTDAVVLASDMTTSHVGALAGEPGVVTAGGTGAVALAVAASGRTARADGWGYLLGDAGSGYAIGRRGLDAALRAHDGRGGSKVLRVLAQRRFGDLDQLPQVVHGAENPPRTIAAFARDVLEAALDGDEWSRTVWAEAGIELARTTAAATAALPVAGEVAVSTTGGLFDAGDALTGPFASELARVLPSGRLQPRAGDALDGAHLMAVLAGLPHESLLIRHEGASR